MYRSILRQFFAWAGDQELTADLVDTYIQELIDSEYRPASIQTKFWAIKSYFKYLGREEELKQISLPKIVPDDPRCATPEEIEKLLEYPYLQLQDELIIIMLYSLGLRIGELVTIEAGDYDAERHLIKVTSEKKRSGPTKDWLELEERVYETLERYLSTQPEGTKYVFTANGNKPLSTETVRYRLSKLCKQVGIRKLNPHSFRHARGTELAKAGLSKQQISAYLRQKSETSAERYIHMTAMDVPKVPTIFSKKKEEESE